ncbi:transposase [Alkalibacillus aidingensis]|uniref:transposase n=1 Tax=Alkalibacillus aidingensis TaxID=2747607 RepID=UPI0016608675|nr:transposase [Alkalibacillus aidingensis]
MPRKRRLWLPQYYYHIVCRGNRRDPLFMDHRDFTAFQLILDDVFEKYPFETASYCLMTNHFHLQIRSQEQSISKLMALINRRYANYYNNRYRLTGHVFEKRFYDQIITDVKGMLETSKYIHLNPVKAQMVHQPTEYHWSSYNFYKSSSRPPAYMNLESILSYYNPPVVSQKSHYCHFVESPDQKKVISNKN